MTYSTLNSLTFLVLLLSKRCFHFKTFSCIIKKFFFSKYDYRTFSVNIVVLKHIEKVMVTKPKYRAYIERFKQ